MQEVASQKNVGCGVISKKNTLKEIETIRFRSSEWWQCFTSGTADPMIYLDQDHITSSTTSLWKHWCVGISLLQESTAKFCLLLTHSLCFANFSFYQGKCSTAILMLHFGQVWQAAWGTWRESRDYPKHWILSTFSVKKFHYRTLEWPVCV